VSGRDHDSPSETNGLEVVDDFRIPAHSVPGVMTSIWETETIQISPGCYRAFTQLPLVGCAQRCHSGNPARQSDNSQTRWGSGRRGMQGCRQSKCGGRL
jgi:hypothetical protein